MFSDYGALDLDSKSRRKFSQDSSPFVKNDRVRFLIEKEPRRFTLDNTYKYKRQPKQPNVGNVTRKLAKLFRRKSSLSEKVSTKVARTETVSEKTERIKIILDQKASRPRSNSEQQYSIMKKDTCFGPLTVLGLIERNSVNNVLENVLDHFTFYDILPCYGLMVAVDSNFTLYKILEVFVKHSLSDICVWDSQKQTYLGCISLFAILGYLFADNTCLKEKFNMKISECKFFDASLDDKTSFNMAFTEPSSNLKEGAQLLASSDKEQIYVFDCDTGNILKSLSCTEILQFILNQVSKFGMHSIEGNMSLESVFQPLNPDQFVNSNTVIKDALQKFVKSPLVLVFAEHDCQTFLTTFTCMDVATFFIDISLDDMENYLDKPLWTILDFRKKVKTSKFYSCHSQTQVANACECMLLTKSEGILVWNRGKPVGLVTPKQILKSFISNKAAENDQTSGSEIFRM